MNNDTDNDFLGIRHSYNPNWVTRSSLTQYQRQTSSFRNAIQHTKFRSIDNYKSYGVPLHGRTPNFFFYSCFNVSGYLLVRYVGVFPKVLQPLLMLYTLEGKKV